MTKYINADVALKHIDDYYEMLKRTGKPSRGMTAVIQNIKTIVNSLPTVDATPIIRCKDCKYYQQGKNADEWLWCMMNHHYTDEEKYCAWAERKEE